MTVEELIKRLQKVKHKEAKVWFKEGDSYISVSKAIVERDLADDEVCVVLQE